MREALSVVAGLVIAGCAQSEAQLPRVTRFSGARHGHRIEGVGNSLVAIGGFEAGSEALDRGAAHTWQMNAGPGPWRKGADMPTPRAFFCSAVVGGRVLAIGKGIDAYDPACDRWETLLPQGAVPDSHFAAAALGNRVYILGGFPTCSGGCVGFDLGSRALFDPPEPPGFETGDHLHIMTALRGEIHVIGGLDGKSFSPKAEHWVLRNGSWEKGTPPPVGLWAKFAIVQSCDPVLYIFEGAKGWRYDAAADRWTALTGPGRVLVMPASVAIGQRIFVLGGMPVDSGSPAGVWEYSIASDHWTID